MRNGLKVYDSDTHVHPSAESLVPYYDAEFRDRLPELEQYLVPARSDPTTSPVEEPGRHHYALGLTPYRRVLGEAEPQEPGKGAPGRLHWGQYEGAKLPAVGVVDDAVAARIADMDEEGADTHMMVPDVFIGVSQLNDPALETGFIRAYHRFVNDLCATHPGRLTALLAVSGTAVEESVAEIKAWGRSPWAAGIAPFAGMGRPMDHPDMEPIWAAAAEQDLAVVQHSATWVPPYFPGYADMDGNRFLARLCSHPWGAMKGVASFIGSGAMDRYPDLRLAILESGCGWLPFWARRMDDQAAYVGFTAKLEHKMSDYITGGRFFASIEMREGEDMIKMVMDFLGDDVLMYASDYPHAECLFPDSVDHVMGWQSLGEDTRRKLFWDNAARLYGAR